MSSICPTSDTTVVVVGQGFVGLAIAMRAVDVGYRVIGFEHNDARVAQLVAGHSYVGDIDSARLRAALGTGRYVPTSLTSNLEGFAVAIVTVPTPLSNGVPDLSFIEQAVRQIAPYLSRDATVVLESTTYPGTTEELVAPLLESGSGLTVGTDFHLGYSPERIDPGNDTWNFQNTPKVVSGINESSALAVQRFYDTIVDRTVLVENCRVAELSKLLENTFRHVNIALVNELAMFANALDVDVWAAIEAAATKPFGFMEFTPGPGVGGHCLPVDPSYLSWKVEQLAGIPFQFIDLANDVNDQMPQYVVRRSIAILNESGRAIRGSHILILGLAYKKNSTDAREAPGPIVCSLMEKMGAVVRVVDPLVDGSDIPSNFQRVELSEDELARADLTVVITDHDQFDWELIAHASTRILDTRHRLDSAANVEFL